MASNTALITIFRSQVRWHGYWRETRVNKIWQVFSTDTSSKLAWNSNARYDFVVIVDRRWAYNWRVIFAKARTSNAGNLLSSEREAAVSSRLNFVNGLLYSYKTVYTCHCESLVFPIFFLFLFRIKDLYGWNSVWNLARITIEVMKIRINHVDEFIWNSNIISFVIWLLQIILWKY